MESRSSPLLDIRLEIESLIHDWDPRSNNVKLLGQSGLMVGYEVIVQAEASLASSFFLK